MSKSCYPDFVKGRGAPSNQTSKRFNLASVTPDGDWLDDQANIDGPPRLRTIVTVERAKTILTRNTSPDIPFDRSVNPYRGCEHGCIYCYARPTHAYHDLSPGLDFESRLFVKPDAPHLLKEALAKPGYRPAPIAFGTNTDPYQPIEAQYRIMRSCLEVLTEANHPLTITTKSDRVLRDLDLLAPMAAKGLVAVAVSVTSLDPATHRSLEPRAAHPEKRLAAIAALSAAGVPAHISVSPIIPAITDHELEALLEAGNKANARSASYIAIRLPHEVAPLFKDWLEVHYPARAKKVMAIIQSLRGERDNDPRFFSRMKGQGLWADLIKARFNGTCKRLGLNERKIDLRSDLFTPPEQGGQMRLF